MSNPRKPSPALVAAAQRLADLAPEFEASTLALAVQLIGVDGSHGRRWG